MKSDDEDKKIFDVSRPSQVRPHPNSRPIIVSHQPSTSDPMVKEPSPARPPAKVDLSHLLPAPDDESKSEPDESKPDATAHHGSIITPSAEFTKEVQGREEGSAKAPPLTSEEGPSLGKAPSTQEADAKAAKAQAEIEKLLASDAYKVPLQSNSRHGLRRHLALGLIILVLALAAAAYMLLASNVFQSDPSY